jgi:hypothetical protein
MKTANILLLAMSLLLTCTDTLAQRVRLSDALSPRQNYSLDLAWQPYELTQMVTALLNGETGMLPPLMGIIPGVEIRLNTSDYVGQRVRIYLVLPATITADPSAGSLQLNWEVSGDFLPGSVHAGQQALIFEGELDSPVTSGTFNFMLLIESDEIQDSFIIEPYYELEVLF